MRKWIQGSFVVLSAALLLTACGDDSDDSSTDVVDDDTTEEVVDTDGSDSLDGTPDTGDVSDTPDSSGDAYAAVLANDGLPITGVYELTSYRDVDDCDSTDTATPPAAYYAIRHIDEPNFNIQRFELVLCDTIADCEGADASSGIPGASDSVDVSAVPSAQVVFNPNEDACTINRADAKTVSTTDDGSRWSIGTYAGPVEISDVENPSSVTCRELAAGVLNQMSCTSVEEYEGTLVTE